MKWLVLIIEAIVRGLFRRSPEERKEAKYEKAMKQWQEEEKILEADRDKAKNEYEAYVAGHRGNGTPGKLMGLHEAYKQASLALGDHRRRQPGRLPYRA